MTKQRRVVQILPRPPEDAALIDSVRLARLNALYAEKALIERTIHLIKTMGTLGIINAPGLTASIGSACRSALAKMVIRASTSIAQSTGKPHE